MCETFCTCPLFSVEIRYCLLPHVFCVSDSFSYGSRRSNYCNKLTRAVRCINLNSLRCILLPCRLPRLSCPPLLRFLAIHTSLLPTSTPNPLLVHIPPIPWPIVSDYLIPFSYLPANLNNGPYPVSHPHNLVYCVRVTRMIYKSRLASYSEGVNVRYRFIIFVIDAK